MGWTIYQINCDDALHRLGLEAQPYPPWEDAAREPFGVLLHERHLVLYHLDENPVPCVEKVLPKLLKPNNAFVLCFKGERLAGLECEMEVLRRARDTYKHRVHFLYSAVPTGAPHGKLRLRLKDFRQHLDDSLDHIDWTVLDPQWPEYLLAFYVAMRGLEAAGPGSQLAIDLSKSPVLFSAYAAANKEYAELTNDSDAILEWPIDPSKAKGAADGLWEVIRPLMI